jgi:hypothetical protein
MQLQSKRIYGLSKCIYGLLVASLFSGVYSQDTLSPSVPGYADILDDWKDQDNISSQPLGTEENVALGKVTTQSSMAYCVNMRENNAYKAVDGITDGNYVAHQVTYTGNEEGAWWQVDLGSAYPVDSVRIWNRADSSADRLSNFDVKLSPDGQTWADTAYMAGQCGRPSIFSFASRSARFVRVQLRGRNFLTLAEVEVFAPAKGYRTAIAAILATLPDSARIPLQTRLDGLTNSADNSPAMVALYVRVCSERRKIRMAPYADKFAKVIFSQHNVLGNGPFFPTDIWRSGGYSGKGLELLQMNGYYGNVTHLLPSGEARSPDVSFDGKRILFAWRNGISGTSKYRLFEMNVAAWLVRPITFGSAVENLYNDYADYQGIYLPNGNILFASTRILQQLDCLADYPVANFFLCNEDGKNPRRICNDQAYTDDPCVLPSGEIAYSRWDYNDKAHTYGHAMFIMHSDGTAQREYCNNNSWWPTMILQARAIPGTTKIMAMIGAYHGPREGKIGIIDVNIGMENGAGVTLVAPVRSPATDTLDYWGGIPLPNEYPWSWDNSAMALMPRFPDIRPLDQWGQNPPQFAHPCPLDENAFLVSYRPASKESSWNPRFGLYFMTVDNQRELLWYDPQGSCMDAVVLAPRTVPPILSSTVDYRQTTGTVQIMNIYDPGNSQAPVLQGIDPHVIKRIRVASLKWRSLGGIGWADHFCAGYINNNNAVGYDTPPATWNASWDAKVIIGESPVLADGSAAFTVPARTPVFFQALDSNNNVVQTMRSWATLQPGETFSCMGCHESKLSALPPVTYVPLAVKRGPLPLEQFYGPPRVFSFTKEIQPILDSKCVSCHSAATPNGINLSNTPVWNEGNRKNWSQSYLSLVNHSNEASNSKYVNWFPAEDVPVLLPPYRTGACKSPLIPLLAQAHHSVTMTKKEVDLIRCWIDFNVPFGDYMEGMNAKDSATTRLWDANKAIFENEDQNNIKTYLTAVRDFGPRSHYSGAVPARWAYVTQNGAKRSVVVRFSVPESADRSIVKINMYTLQGRLVGALFNEDVSKGSHVYRLNPMPLAAGYYLLTLNAKWFTGTQQILVMQ